MDKGFTLVSLILRSKRDPLMLVLCSHAYIFRPSSNTTTTPVKKFWKNISTPLAAKSTGGRLPICNRSSSQAKSLGFQVTTALQPI